MNVSSVSEANAVLCFTIQGFVRTDQLERSKDADGNPIDTSLFKIINTQSNLTVDGEPFPFESSTPLYPEWNVAALSHVPEDISRYVQEVMLELAEHARVGSRLSECQESLDEAECTSLVLSNATVCTSRDVALVAKNARTKGKYTGRRLSVICSSDPCKKLQV